MTRRCPTWRGCLLATVLAAVWLSPPAAAEDQGAVIRHQLASECPERPAGVPADAVLEAQGAVISRIETVVENIFDLADPAEDTWLFRTANRLHWKTRPRVIQDQLLVKAGDVYSRRLLDDSERLLRSRSYLREVCVQPVAYRDHQVEVGVVVRDVWTLSGGLSFGRKGGVNSTSIGIEDKNFLGTGTSLEVRSSSSVDRTSQSLSYRHPSLSRLRADLELGYADNSDGESAVLQLERPFYSPASRWGAAARAGSDDRLDRRYFRGQVVDTYRHQIERLELSAGLSRGLRGGRALRFTFGATFAQDRFQAAAREAPPIELPEDRRLVYPWIGFERVEDAYAETFDLDKIQRTEDRYLGRRLSARLGWSSPSLGGDRDRAILSAELGDAYQRPAGDLFELSTSLTGRWGRDGAENLRLAAAGRYLRRTFRRHLLAIRLAGDLGFDLDVDAPLLLGGDSGLRGYPLRYQTGNRRALLSIEQRFFSDWHVLRLFHVGAAAFFDLGRAWDTSLESPPDDPGAGLLSDLGMGLRISSSRSSRGSILHLDVAFPLAGDSSISSVQFLVSTHQTF